MSATETEINTATWVHYHDGGIPGRRRILLGKAAKESFNEIPKIDFRRVYSDKLEDRKQLAKEVSAACRNVGFFYAVNHGVDEELLNDTFEALKRYFALPTEVKMECHNAKTERFRGYEAFLEGKMDPTTRGDLKEGFLMGDDATDPEQKRAIPASATPRNQWPTHPDALFWRPALYRYYDAMYVFSKRMLKIFALALDQPEDHFDSVTTNPMTHIRAVHYPPRKKKTTKTAYPALEVLNGNGIWIPVQPELHSFVINIADFLKLVTGGSWQSTVHRVRNIGGEERYSMPFFFSPNEDARVGVIEHLRKEGEVYEDVVATEYFQERLDIDRRSHLEGEKKKKGGLGY
ncbi:hypothetical protein GQ44DRAFT_698818 [Phaeosphaeriaceae sp. PMI808]|nr:hypothetical protein GQ44DRAFT_698818 [Phaeosphaeriaceae sp. PMI808]